MDGCEEGEKETETGTETESWGSRGPTETDSPIQ